MASVTNEYPLSEPKLIWTVNRLTDKNNNQIGYVISVNSASQDNHRNSEVYLDNIIKHFPGFLYWKDKNLIYRGCNLNFSKAAGFNSPQDIIGKTDYDLAWGGTEAELFRQGDRETLAGKDKYNF